MSAAEWLEFDVSSLPPNVTVESAVFSVNMNGITPPLVEMDIFAFAGNGVVEASDALQTTTPVGTLTANYAVDGFRSYGTSLNTSVIQSLIDSGDHLALVTKIDELVSGAGKSLSVHSSENFYDYNRPALHLVLTSSEGPSLTANSLTVGEGGTVVLSASVLAATDPDSDDASLIFTVSNVNRGQFLLNGTPATSFTQADVSLGQVSFVHDDSEYAPSYYVEVSDGTSSAGPQLATIAFSGVTDNPPVIPAGQSFSVNENVGVGTLVGTVSFNDADLPPDTFDLDIVAGNGDGTFAIDNSGQLSILDDADLDYETTTTYTLTIEVFDGVFTTSEEIVVDVLDSAELDSLTLDYQDAPEDAGPFAFYGHVTRNGELSQPMVVTLSSSDETELVVPASVEIPANQSSASFAVEVVDDTVLDGDILVTVTGTTPGGGFADANVTILDAEGVSFEINALASPVLAVWTVTNTDRDDPVTIYTDSTRPDEISLPPVTIPAGQQSVSVPITIQSDSIPEGPHMAKLLIHAPPGYATGDSHFVQLQDPGVTSFAPTADGDATDTDQDLTVFEDLRVGLNSLRIRGYQTEAIGESRGILEYDLSSLASTAVIQSAVLTLDVDGSAGTTNLDIDVFAYSGDGQIDVADANQTSLQVGQFATDLGILGLRGYPIALDTASVQTIVDSGDYLGMVAVKSPVNDGFVSVHSSEFYEVAQQPLLHLVLAHRPQLTANSLTVDEGATVTLTASDLAASDIDSDESSLTFSVTNVNGGQFLLSGLPTNSFTQSDVTNGVVSFEHDDGEQAPSYDVTVSDGGLSSITSTASIVFANVNDNPPQIAVGQTFSVSEDAANGTSIGSVSFSDSDLPGDSLHVSIASGNVGGVFAIDNGGNLTVADNASLDFETRTNYTLGIQVFDGVNTSVQDVTGNVGDVNDNAPSLTANSLTLSEGESITLGSAQLAATDVDSSTLTFSVASLVAGDFQISGTSVSSFTQNQLNSGAVVFVHDDSESPPSYEVTVSDGTFTDGPQAATIVFSNVNDNEPEIPIGQIFAVSEDAANGASVGTITFSDSDLPGDSLHVSIASGNVGGVFAIDNGGNLTVADNANLDFETLSSYTLSIQVFDGVYASSQDATVNVLDVPEGPVTKFFVVDTSVDDMFEYEDDGTPIVSYGLGSGNNAPRGAASTVAGDTVWVVDNDKWVYVYDTEGNLTSSWKTSGLSRPEGIATDGTHIWIVDRQHDRVFQFDDGASFTSGTHTADSSFALNGSNKAPRGITTDGANLWVVNGRSGTDHVFKYTVAGSYLGSWQLDGQNSRPEGITIDPAGGDALWIVDRDVDQVFQYSGGTAWTSGARSADAAFDLAAGNSNPRGIADPPPASDAVRQLAEDHLFALLSFDSDDETEVWSNLPTNRRAAMEILIQFLDIP